MNIDHLSVSRMNTYQTCALQYKYKYHLKILPKEEPIYFAYGKIVHKIIELYTKEKGKRNINEIVSDVTNGKIEIESGKHAKPLPIDYRQKLPQHIISFLKLSKFIGLEGEVEWNFRFDLDPPKNKHLVGVIDRVIRNNDKFFIIDYKTTKKGPWRKTQENIHQDLQLQSYARIIQKEYNVSADKIRTALYFLEGAELVKATFNDNVLDSVEKNLLKAYDEIYEMNPDNVYGTVDKHCWRCDYKDRCPFFNKN